MATKPTPSALLAGFGAGSLFGSALLLSGVWSPAVIVGQLQLANFHMLEAFVAATAVSGAAIFVADRTGWSPIQVRMPRALRFGGGSTKDRTGRDAAGKGTATKNEPVSYSANILGGLGVGVGMALTGACPGTVLVQAAVGVAGARWIAAGGLAGGALFRALKPHILYQHTAPVTPTPPPPSSKTAATKYNAHTIPALLHISPDVAVLIYEAMCLGMLEGALRWGAHPATHPASVLSPPLGGLFIGLAQAATLLLTRRTVGISGAYGDLAGGDVASPNVLFALGVMVGSAALAGRIGLSAGGVAGNEPLPAFVGGVVSIFGASLAGGCTSGHGISGTSTLSTASLITVAAMFGGGIATALMLT